MTMLWDPPTEIQASDSAAPPVGVGLKQNGARRQGLASPRQIPPRPCLLRAVSALPEKRDGRLRRKSEPKQFLRLAEDENQMRVDKTS